MNNVSSIKEYYIKMHNMMNNCVNMLTALNQSLSTNSSEVYMNLTTASGDITTVRIPSFIYIENKLESLENTIDTIINMPDSGEAWFNNSSNMYKIELVKSNIAPVTPIIDKSDGEIKSYLTTNNILKDIVTPKMFLRINLGNIPDNVSKMLMKKYVFFDPNLAARIQSSCTTYEEYEQMLSTLTNGVEYEAYEKTLDMPIKREKYISNFEIISVEDTTPQNAIKRTYSIHVNTIKYTDKDDSSIEYKLKVGNYLTLEDEYVLYKITSIRTEINNTIAQNYSILNDDSYDHIIEVEEEVGHIVLQSTYENSSMVLKYNNSSFDEYKYVDIPLEENRFITVFLSSIYNNVRSTWSSPLFFDMDDVKVYDTNGDPIKDHVTGNPLSYMEYYNKYCINLGDLIDGISKVAYMQISNLSNIQLKELLYANEIKELVNSTLKRETEDVMNVTRINKHIVNDSDAQNIISLHEQKSNLNSQLRSIQNNINTVYDQLINTDFSQEISISQETLRETLTQYYNEKTSIQEQLLDIIDNINISKGDIENTLSDKAKYRIRGVTNMNDFITFIHEQYSYKLDVVGCDIEYKYKSLNSSLTNVEATYNTVFTQWNKQTSYDRERTLIYDDETNTYDIEYINDSILSDIIKWNQIDIPISKGESVIVRVRYKYNIGQPFINLYTPWSDEFIVDFPTEFVDSSSVNDIIDENSLDIISNKFIRTLISEGYQEHNNNKIIDNSTVFYHMPENIYSGFNTPENKMISLKDKLNDLTNELTNYKSIIDNQLNSTYRVYLEYDNNMIELHNDTDNSLLINELQGKTMNSFIKKQMNIIIKNTGSVPIKLYSIFPGNINIPLLLTNKQYYNQYIVNYERVPLFIKDAQTKYESIYAQTLGQWIYFRQNNPYNYADLYHNTLSQRNSDITNIYDILFNNSPIKKLSFIENSVSNMNKNNMQPLLGYRKRSLYANDSLYNDNSYTSVSDKWSKLSIDRNGNFTVNMSPELSLSRNTYINDPIIFNNFLYKYNEIADEKGIDFFIYNEIGLKYKNYIGENGLPWNETEDPKDNIIASEYYSYVDNNENKWVGKYSHFIGIDKQTGKNLYLNENDDISTFVSENMKDIDSKKMSGAFFYPEILSVSQIKCDINDSNQYKVIETGKDLTLPVIFEYYLDGQTNTNITKTISFDIRTSLLEDPINYTISVKAQYNYNSSVSDISNNISMTDALISAEQYKNDKETKQLYAKVTGGSSGNLYSSNAQLKTIKVTNKIS